MEAYYENMELLGQVQADVDMLRYMLQPEEEEEEEEEEEQEEEHEEEPEEETGDVDEQEEPLEPIEFLDDIIIPVGPEDSKVEDKSSEPEIDSAE